MCFNRRNAKRRGRGYISVTNVALLTLRSERISEILFMSALFLQRPASSFMCVGSMKTGNSAHVNLALK
jgi:hypothetical protein